MAIGTNDRDLYIITRSAEEMPGRTQSRRRFCCETSTEVDVHLHR